MADQTLQAILDRGSEAPPPTPAPVGNPDLQEMLNRGREAPPPTPAPVDDQTLQGILDRGRATPPSSPQEESFRRQFNLPPPDGLQVAPTPTDGVTSSAPTSGQLETGAPTPVGGEAQSRYMGHQLTKPNAPLVVQELWNPIARAATRTARFFGEKVPGELGINVGEERPDAREFSQDPAQTTVTTSNIVPGINEVINSNVNAVARGVLEGTAATIEGLSIIAEHYRRNAVAAFGPDPFVAPKDPDRRALQRWGKEMRKLAVKQFKGDPRRQEAFVTKLFTGVGQLLPFMLPTGAVGVIGKAAGMTRAAIKTATLTSLVTSGVASNAGAAYDLASRFTDDETERLTFAMILGAVGASEAAPIHRLFGRLGKQKGTVLMQALLEARDEAVQEALIQVPAEIITRNVRGLGPSVGRLEALKQMGEAGVLATILGGGLGAGGAMVVKGLKFQVSTQEFQALRDALEQIQENARAQVGAQRGATQEQNPNEGVFDAPTVTAMPHPNKGVGPELEAEMNAQAEAAGVEFVGVDDLGVYYRHSEIGIFAADDITAAGMQAGLERARAEQAATPSVTVETGPVGPIPVPQGTPVPQEAITRPVEVPDFETQAEVDAWVDENAGNPEARAAAVAKLEKLQAFADDGGGRASKLQEVIQKMDDLNPVQDDPILEASQQQAESNDADPETTTQNEQTADPLFGEETPVTNPVLARAVEIDRAEAKLKEMSRAELKSEAKKKGVSAKGNNRNLRERLARNIHGDRERARQFLRSMQEQTGIPSELMDELSQVDPQTYEQTKTSELYEQIRAWLDESPINATLARQYAFSDVNPSAMKGVVFGALIDRHQADLDFVSEREVIEEYDEQLRESGRFLQTARTVVAGQSGESFMRGVKSSLAAHNVELTDEQLVAIRQAYVASRGIIDEDVRLESVGEVVEQLAMLVPTTISDWVGAYRYTNMLSNPQAHERNLWGNFFQAFVARPATLVGNLEVAEAIRYEVTAMRAVGQAISAARASWRSGKVNERFFETSQQWRDQFEQERMRQGADGNLIYRRLLDIGRALEAQDVFFATMIKAGEERRLVANGVSVEKATKQAAEFAEEMLFRQPLGKQMSDKNKALAVRALDGAGKFMQDLRKVPLIGPVASWFFPFIRTPINIGKKMVEYSPLGYVTQKGGKLSKEDIGRANVGSMVVFIGATLAAMGRTTTRAPRDEESRKQWYAAGMRPWSIIIGNKVVPMLYFGPFAAALAIPAAVRDVIMDDPTSVNAKEVEQLAKISQQLTQFYTSQTPLKSAGTFLDIANGRTDFTTQSALAFTGGQAVYLSGFMRWANGLMIDPVYRRGGDFLESLQKDLPLASLWTKPHLTPEGTPARRDPLSMLLPYAIGTVEHRHLFVQQQRAGLLKEKDKINREIDHQVRLIAKDEHGVSELRKWMTLHSGGFTGIDEGDLIRRMHDQLKQRGLDWQGRPKGESIELGREHNIVPPGSGLETSDITPPVTL